MVNCSPQRLKSMWLRLNRHEKVSPTSRTIVKILQSSIMKHDAVLSNFPNDKEGERKETAINHPPSPPHTYPHTTLPPFQWDTTGNHQSTVIQSLINLPSLKQISCWVILTKTECRSLRLRDSSVPNQKVKWRGNTAAWWKTDACSN